MPSKLKLMVGLVAVFAVLAQPVFAQRIRSCTNCRTFQPSQAYATSSGAAYTVYRDGPRQVTRVYQNGATQVVRGGPVAGYRVVSQTAPTQSSSYGSQGGYTTTVPTYETGYGSQGGYSTGVITSVRYSSARDARLVMETRLAEAEKALANADAWESIAAKKAKQARALQTAIATAEARSEALMEEAAATEEDAGPTIKVGPLSMSRWQPSLRYVAADWQPPARTLALK